MVFSTSGIYSSPISEIMTCLCFWIYSESILLLFLVWNQIIFQTETTLISFLWLMTQQSHLIYHVLNFFHHSKQSLWFFLSCSFTLCFLCLPGSTIHHHGSLQRSHKTMRFPLLFHCCGIRSMINWKFLASQPTPQKRTSPRNRALVTARIIHHWLTSHGRIDF